MVLKQLKLSSLISWSWHSRPDVSLAAGDAVPHRERRSQVDSATDLLAIAQELRGRAHSVINPQLHPSATASPETRYDIEAETMTPPNLKPPALNQQRGFSCRGNLLLCCLMLAGHSVWAADPLPVPPTGVYLGIRANPALGATQESAIEIREGAPPLGINRRFSLHLLYYGWPVIAQMQNGNGVFAPDTDLLGDIAHQRVPVIAWNCDDGFMNSDRLIAGGNAPEDAVITATAKVLKVCEAFGVLVKLPK